MVEGRDWELKFVRETDNTIKIDSFIAVNRELARVIGS